MEVITKDLPEGLLWQLLYGDDLILSGSGSEYWKRKIKGANGTSRFAWISHCVIFAFTVF